MNTKDISVIPYGYYCYDENRICPYWSIKEELPERENGHCSYLGESDWDINEESGEIEVFGREGELLGTDPAHSLTMSLLWDHCKECDINLPKEGDNA